MRINIGDVVWFQAYKENEPIQGKVKRKGTPTKLNIGFGRVEPDKRVFYELETLDSRPFVFTRTTKKWISKTKQSWGILKDDLYNPIISCIFVGNNKTI